MVVRPSGAPEPSAFGWPGPNDVFCLCAEVTACRGSDRDRRMNLAIWVERHGRRRPDDPALAEGERVHADWGAFAARTAAAAGGLRDDFGLSPGDRVAIVMRNRPEYLEALFAIWHAGLVAVPVNARLHRDEIAYILDAQRRRPSSSPTTITPTTSSRWSAPSLTCRRWSWLPASDGTGSRRRRRRRSSTGSRTTRPGSSTRAARPVGRRERRSPTATCS